MTKPDYTFEISLSVLNHLGRHLYRSFVTILGEAISNAWDADAKNVWIYIDREKNSFVIKDDGVGMNEEDFQNKFLSIGYSKRETSGGMSRGGRPFIGRKGIGKLALLSCSRTVAVMSKTATSPFIGGVIDNPDLDAAIKDNLKPNQYHLAPLKEDLFSPYVSGSETQGTVIYFGNVKGGIRNTLDLLKKIVALYFRFSLVDENFNIFIDGEKITIEHLKDLGERTEFLWNINDLQDPYINSQLPNLKEVLQIKIDYPIKGFIASVGHYRDLNIMNLDEKVGIDLFVNGRLRERDILRHVSKARVVESYLYGQIHFNDLDEEQVDRFTSSREGVIPDDEKYLNFLAKFKEEILDPILNSWDKLRRKHRKDGDPENLSITPGDRKAEELFNVVSEDFVLPEDSENKRRVKKWIDVLGDDAAFNFRSYAQCFISENLLRNQIRETGAVPASCSKIQPASGQTCIDRLSAGVGSVAALCPYCKGEKGKESLVLQKTEAGTNIQIRSAESDGLMYLDYIDLAKIINDTVLRNEDKAYKPLRNSVMHTSLLTFEAKTRLTSIFHNIIATVKRIVG